MHGMVTARRELTKFDTRLEAAGLTGTDLARLSPQRTRRFRRPKPLNVACQRDRQDESGSAVNPDLRARSGAVHLAVRKRRPSCRFILEALSAGSGLRSCRCFSHFASARRIVLPASKFLPTWLRPLPRFVQRKRRQYWWSFRAKPVSGWHVQQFLKIAASHLAASPAILHPGFRRRVLPGFRPVAF